MNTPANNESFSSYRRLILKELQDLNEAVEKLNDKLTIVNNNVITLKAKAGVWGAIAGVLPGLIVAIIWWINKSG